MRVVVVGAGVYGAAVGAALVRRGATVTVVDAGAPGSGTSGATFSWVNSRNKQPLVYHQLNVAGMAAHQRLAAEFPLGDWYFAGGGIEWGGDEAALRAKVDALLALGYEAKWLTPAETLDLEPGIDPDRLPPGGTAYFPGEAWVEPRRLIAHLLSRSIDVVAGDAVAGLDISGDVVRAVRLESGRLLAADAVVNCAGPQAAGVAAMAGLALPMRNLPCVLVYTSPVAVPLSRVVHAPDVHLRPEGGGRILVHSSEVDRGGQEAVDKLVRDAASLYPGIRAATVESVRTGERPIPGDGLPVLGRVADVRNYFFAVSHSGVTLCLHAGELVADEVVGEDREDALAPFRFERFEESR
ncbi:glycine/D-amino acid oxidase-like deaminating enzyme [Lentzea atacamensis]|uniref:Glycine/D-amino acid oxidase-like deaminating enzyme n=1 Tax=Lentzea atacamensis TaxID=531938 RepID=A0A316HKU0_9PSEU|nr:FAD-binding oxidoreductase [Lentzea atacamensis]PWK81287.1 glycine/D-amino acid oxidase-like deaminating enzyme [Lentzea atacamensis]